MVKLNMNKYKVTIIFPLSNPSKVDLFFTVNDKALAELKALDYVFHNCYCGEPYNIESITLV